MSVTYIHMLIGGNFLLGLYLTKLGIQLLSEFNQILSIYDFDFDSITFITLSNKVLCMPSYFDFVF